MAVTADFMGPFDAGTGANWTEDSWRQMMRRMLPQSGIIATGQPSTAECQVFGDATGMQVKMKVGEVFIRGHYGEFTSQKTLSIATAHATLARKDRVVLRADFVNNRIEADVLTGTAAGSPTVPSLTQTTSMWETSVAVVDVPAADASIDAAQVTDDRHYASQGIVGWHRRTTNSTQTTQTSQSSAQKVCQLDVRLRLGRLYSVYCSNVGVYTIDAGRARLQLTYTIDGTTPAASSAVLAVSSEEDTPGGSRVVSRDLGKMYAPTADVTFKVLLSVWMAVAGTGGTYGTSTWPLDLVIEDIGINPGTAGTNF
jgi:hypothetical protein